MCPKCRAAARAREWYAANVERARAVALARYNRRVAEDLDAVREQKRAYDQENRLKAQPRHRKANRRYRMRHPERHLDSNRKYRQQNPERMRARDAVARAIRKGVLLRQSCGVCGAEPAQAHHPDYSKPLEVIWLCSAHHGEEHQR